MTPTTEMIQAAHIDHIEQQLTNQKERSIAMKTGATKGSMWLATGVLTALLTAGPVAAETPNAGMMIDEIANAGPAAPIGPDDLSDGGDPEVTLYTASLASRGSDFWCSAVNTSDKILDITFSLRNIHGEIFSNETYIFDKKITTTASKTSNGVAPGESTGLHVYELDAVAYCTITFRGHPDDIRGQLCVNSLDGCQGSSDAN